MPSTKDRRAKNKLLKIDVSSDSDSDGSEHELSYHAKDKVKLMKEVLKLIKPKKIKSMAPDCIKDLDIVDINSMLLEELLGISNKRLQYIFNGENVDRETSSSESEEEKPPIDVISLDDISDDDDIELCINQNEKDSSKIELSQKDKKLGTSKIKTEVLDTTIKLEKRDKMKKEAKKKSKKINEIKSGNEDLKEADKDKLMSVLELLELQARARAIRSQLAIETEKKKEPDSQRKDNVKQEDESDSDAVIIESPQHKEIIITSSDSEEENGSKKPQVNQNEDSSTSELLSKPQQNTESDSIPPQKKQKQILGKNAEANSKKQKEKLLSKLQKIKLVRNKTTTETPNTDSRIIQTTNEECNNNISTDVVTIEDVSKMNDINPETVIQNIAVNVDANHELNDSVNNTQCNMTANVINEASSSKFIKLSPKEIHKKITSYCDNDEIVINLDEDEMDGIEND